MNDKIRELAKQCRYTYESDRGVYQEFDEQKFAELLIRECANLNFRSTGFVTSEGEDMVRSMIKQHFGVE